MTQNLSSLYTIEVYDANNNFLADLTGLATVSKLYAERNGYSTCEFNVNLFYFENFCKKINIYPMSILYVNMNYVKIKRGGRYLFGGQINYVNPQLTDQAQSSVINVRVAGYLSLFKQRFTGAERVFTSTDAGTIAYTLINESQALTNGDYGITSGTIQTSVNRDRTYAGYKCIADAIIELSQVVNGFDFEFTYDKKFNVYYPSMGIDRTASTIFEYPKNIKTINFEYDGSLMVNSDILLGNGIVSVRSDTTYQSLFKLRQRREEFSDVIISTTLENKGDETLRIYKNLNPIITSIDILGNIEPYVGSYWLGDQVKIKVNDIVTFSPVNNQTYKIDTINIGLDQNSMETINLGLSLV